MAACPRRSKVRSPPILSRELPAMRKTVTRIGRARPRSRLSTATVVHLLEDHTIRVGSRRICPATTKTAASRRWRIGMYRSPVARSGSGSAARLAKSGRSRSPIAASLGLSALARICPANPVSIEDDEGNVRRVTSADSQRLLARDSRHRLRRRIFEPGPAPCLPRWR